MAFLKQEALDNKLEWGRTENSVRIQIAVIIITYCLVAIINHDMKLERSTYEVLQILTISLTDKTPLIEPFKKLISTIQRAIRSLHYGIIWLIFNSSKYKRETYEIFFENILFQKS